MITQERLKELIEYNPETGEFKRKKRKGKCNALSSNGSITIGIQRENHYAQRLAFLYMEGYFPENDVVHLNGDKQDNRWCNLREASRACAAKFAGIQRNNTSGVVGVYLHKSGKYAAQIYTNKRTYFLGMFEEFKDAVRARYEAECSLNDECRPISTAYQWLEENNEI